MNMIEDEEFAADEKERIDSLHRTAPESIWLQIDPEAEQFNGWDDQTWCSDQINDTDLKYVRADRIEQIETERDALQADNERLREALDEASGWNWLDEDIPPNVVTLVENALSATPEQSLARIRNQVREECAALCDEQDEKDRQQQIAGNQPDDYVTGYGDGCGDCGHAIRAMKEPE